MNPGYIDNYCGVKTVLVKAIIQEKSLINNIQLFSWEKLNWAFQKWESILTFQLLFDSFIHIDPALFVVIVEETDTEIVPFLQVDELTYTIK